MEEFDELLFSRHSTHHLKGEVPIEKISVPEQKIMAELDEIFASHRFNPNFTSSESISDLGALLFTLDPIGIVDQENPLQSDEYFPEADLILWLQNSGKLNPRTFWAVWEYQFADSNPYANEDDQKLRELLVKVEDKLNGL